MATMVRKIADVFVGKVTALVVLFVSKFEYVINEEKVKRLQKRCAYCHEDVKIYFPVYIEPKNNITINEGVSIGPYVQIWAHGGVNIGKNTMIASHCIITTSTHDYTIDPMNSKRIDKPVSIGENVWFGSGAIIMPGVSIGDGAVIGAGAVVTRDVAANAIVVGSPARVLKMRMPA